MSDFPAAIPNFTDLNPALTLAANNHGARHNKVHAEVDAIATKVGVSSSADNTSLDYKLQNVTTGNKAETASNKSIDATLVGNSDVLYPSQKAVKTYVDAGLATKLTGNTSSATTDAIVGNSSASSGTVYGVSVAAGLIVSAAIAGKVNTAAIQASAVTGDKIASYGFTSQADTTNTTQTAAKIYCGWGQILGNSTASMLETVTFPASITTVLSISINFIGYKSGGTPATVITQFDTKVGAGASIEAINNTTTGFTAAFSSTGSFGAVYHGYSWFATVV